MAAVAAPLRVPRLAVTDPPVFCIGEPSVVLIVERAVLPVVWSAEVAAPVGRGRLEAVTGKEAVALGTMETALVSAVAWPTGATTETLPPELPPEPPPPPQPEGRPEPPEMFRVVAPAVSMAAR